MADLPRVRVPMAWRLRFAADVFMAAQAVPKGAPAMRSRRCFRLAMERRRLLRLRTMRDGIR